MKCPANQGLGRRPARVNHALHATHAKRPVGASGPKVPIERQRAMTRKGDFNADEWSTVVEGPLLAGARVITAGRGGTIRESLALGKVYAHAREQQDHSELLDDLVSSPPVLDAKRLQGAGDISAAATQGLRDALSVLAVKASQEEVDAYKRFVLSLAEAAAQAHKEGGFLGIGGKRVSAEEQAALDEVAAVLDAG